MYLTKLELPLASRRTAEALADTQVMHRMVTAVFSSSRGSARILYRVRVLRGVVQLYVYSAVPSQELPQGVALIGQRDLTDWLSAMEAGEIWNFDLLAMPSKKVYQDRTDANSRRRVLRTGVERMDWLRRQAARNGFSLLQAEELEQSHSRGLHPQEKGGRMYWDAYHFQGTLRVEDPDRFRYAVTDGIGPGKAYGLGMLLLKRL